MNRRRYLRYYRRMHTTQERRMSFACEAKYVRASRNAVNLPNSWDDKHVRLDTSWKKLRKTQYRPEGRGKKHEMTIGVNDNQLFETRGHRYKYSVWRLQWKLKEYFDDMDIPYEFEEVKEAYNYERPVKKWVVTGKEPVYVRHFTRTVQPDGTKKLQYVVSHQIGWRDTGDWCPTGEIENVKCHTTIGYKVTWWSDKDIGMDYVIGSIGHY